MPHGGINFKPHVGMESPLTRSAPGCSACRGWLRFTLSRLGCQDFQRCLVTGVPPSPPSPPESPCKVWGTPAPARRKALSQGPELKARTGCLNDRGRTCSGDKFLLPEHRRNLFLLLTGKRQMFHHEQTAEVSLCAFLAGAES